MRDLRLRGIIKTVGVDGESELYDTQRARSQAAIVDKPLTNC